MLVLAQMNQKQRLQTVWQVLKNMDPSVLLLETLVSPSFHQPKSSQAKDNQS
jgi:hypothetical protein